MTFSAVAGKCSTPAAVKAAAPRLTSPNVTIAGCAPAGLALPPDDTAKQAADEDPDQEDEVEFHAGTEREAPA
jgi:hypothetical protein